jgi:enoyl-CoA hydratase/carnithine racemase
MTPDPPVVEDATLVVADRVATLTLNRDDVRNELTGTRLSAEIAAVATWLNRCEDVSALVIIGAGRSFSAGGNVKDMDARSGAFSGDAYALQQRYRSGIQQIALTLDRLDIPSIAAINGAAVGAGFDLACMCDFRFAASGAVMGETFVNLGIIPGDGGAWFLQRLIGYQQAAALTLTGRRFDADEARAMGIVLEVVAPEQLSEHVAAFAAELAAKPPQALRLTKRLLRSAQRMELADFLDTCAVVQAICHETADHREAVSAFLDKRPPRFEGV